MVAVQELFSYESCLDVRIEDVYMYMFVDMYFPV